MEMEQRAKYLKRKMAVARADHGITQRKVADALGYNHGYVSQILNGRLLMQRAQDRIEEYLNTHAPEMA